MKNVNVQGFRNTIVVPGLGQNVGLDKKFRVRFEEPGWVDCLFRFK